MLYILQLIQDNFFFSSHVKETHSHIQALWEIWVLKTITVEPAGINGKFLNHMLSIAFGLKCTSTK